MGRGLRRSRRRQVIVLEFLVDVELLTKHPRCGRAGYPADHRPVIGVIRIVPIPIVPAGGVRARGFDIVSLIGKGVSFRIEIEPVRHVRFASRVRADEGAFGAVCHREGSLCR